MLRREYELWYTSTSGHLATGHNYEKPVFAVTGEVYWYKNEWRIRIEQPGVGGSPVPLRFLVPMGGSDENA